MVRWLAIRDMRYAIRGLRYAQFAILIFLIACRVAPPPANGWAIVAADPQTGDVGVAGASCSEFPFDSRAVLVPNKGAGALLGVHSPLLRDRFGAWIEQPRDASTIVEQISAPRNDLYASQRQYGIVTIRDRVAQSVTFTGSANALRAGDAWDSNFAVAVVGNGLANQEMITGMLTTFQLPNASAFALSDRLLRALETGSAQGGVALCNQNGVEQTAASAFIMLARGGDPVFQVSTLGNTAAQEKKPPYLALSITAPIGGRNAVRGLREQYDVWRERNLPACAECAATRMVVPEGGTRLVTQDGFLSENALWLVAGFVLLCMFLTIVFFSVRPRHRPLPEMESK